MDKKILFTHDIITQCRNLHPKLLMFMEQGNVTEVTNILLLKDWNSVGKLANSLAKKLYDSQVFFYHPVLHLDKKDIQEFETDTYRPYLPEKPLFTLQLNSFENDWEEIEQACQKILQFFPSARIGLTSLKDTSYINFDNQDLITQVKQYHIHEISSSYILTNVDTDFALTQKRINGFLHKQWHKFKVKTTLELPLANHPKKIQNWLKPFEKIGRGLKDYNFYYVSLNIPPKQEESFLDAKRDLHQIAIIRILTLILDIPHVQISIDHFGPKFAQVALEYGVDTLIKGVTLDNWSSKKVKIDAKLSNYDDIIAIIQDINATPVVLNGE